MTQVSVNNHGVVVERRVRRELEPRDRQGPRIAGTLKLNWNAR